MGKLFHRMRNLLPRRATSNHQSISTPPCHIPNLHRRHDIPAAKHNRCSVCNSFANPKIPFSDQLHSESLPTPPAMALERGVGRVERNGKQWLLGRKLWSLRGKCRFGKGKRGKRKLWRLVCAECGRLVCRGTFRWKIGQGEWSEGLIGRWNLVLIQSVLARQQRQGCRNRSNPLKRIQDRRLLT